MRVGTLPLIGTILRSGRFSCRRRARRGLLLPTVARSGNPATPPEWRDTSRSPTGARGRIAGRTRPAGVSTGRSLRLWTARSMSPESSASSSCLVNSPAPSAVGSWRGITVRASPVVVMIFSSTSRPLCRASRPSRTIRLWARARSLPRVPRMSLIVAAPGRAGIGATS